MRTTADIKRRSEIRRDSACRHVSDYRGIPRSAATAAKLDWKRASAWITLSDNVARHARCVIIARSFPRVLHLQIFERAARESTLRNPPRPGGQKNWNCIAYPARYRDAINFRVSGITRWRLILSNRRGSQRGSIKKKKNDCNGRSSDDEQRFERAPIFNINKTRLESSPGGDAPIIIRLKHLHVAGIYSNAIVAMIDRSFGSMRHFFMISSFRARRIVCLFREERIPFARINDEMTLRSASSWGKTRSVKRARASARLRLN